MYVDDEESLIFLAKRALARIGYVVTGYTDPNAALSAFRGEPGNYDLVVTDASMPYLSGFDLAREIRTISPATPVLMATGYIRTGDEATALAVGIRALLLKPVTAAEMSATVTRIMGDRTTAR